MKIERLIFPLAAASVLVSIAHFFGPAVGLGAGFLVVLLLVLRIENDRRRWEERERRHRIREAAWRMGERSLR